jgi:hypothetical protein
MKGEPKMNELQITLLALEVLRARKVAEHWSADDEAEFRDIVAALDRIAAGAK